MGSPKRPKQTFDRTPENASGGDRASIEGANPGATPGSLEGGTLAGTPGYLAGGAPGKDPQSPRRVPPYGDLDVTPEGVTEEALTGTTLGGRLGSTGMGRVGSSTDDLRDLTPADLPHEEEHPHEHRETPS